MGRRVSPWMHAKRLWDEQGGICAWPLCKFRSKMVVLSGNHGDYLAAQVDHNHRCCDNERTCGKCVRGLVHRICNMKYIRWADWAIDNGFAPPFGPVGEYLTIGESHCRDEDRLPWGYREAIVPHRSLIDELEADIWNDLRPAR